MSLFAMLALLGGYAAATPASAAPPQSITFPLNVSRAVIESQAPETWCYWRGDSCHHDYPAADIFAPTGTPVVSPVAGRVVSANQRTGGVGSTVQIIDDQNNLWYLAHMHHSPGLTVAVDDRVAPGTVIGYVGTENHAVGTQPHLHIDMLVGYTSRPECSGEACQAHPFVDIQSLLVAAFDDVTPPPPPPPPPPPSERKGASGASVVSWDTGRFDAFGRGGGGRAYQTFYQRGGASWPGWAALGGSNGLRSQPVAVSWGTGRLDVFAVGSDQRMKHWWFDRLVDNRWRGPETLGNTTFVGNPAVVTFDPGRIDVFARDTNDNLRHNYFQRGGSSWPGWETLGAGIVADPAVVQWHAGRWDVFATHSTRKLRHWWFDRLGDSTWRGPEVIGNIDVVGTPAVVSWHLGRIDVFARDTNNNLRHNYVQSGTTVWPAWETWATGIMSNPVGVSWVNGRLDVFATDNARKLRHWWFDRLAGDTTRNGPEVLGDTTFTGAPGTLTAAAWAPGRLDVFGVDTNNTMRHSYFERGVTTWTAWEHLGGTFT